MRRLATWTYGLGCAAWIALPARADEPPKKPWSNSAEVSILSTNGNSKTNTMKAAELFREEWAKALLELQGNALGSSDHGHATAEQYDAGEKVGFKFSERDYVFEKFAWDKNRFAGIRNRTNTSAGYGRKVIDSTSDKLNAELGAGYINEKHTDQSQKNFATGRAYLLFEHALSETARFTQDAEYLPRLDDPSDFRLNTKTALTASLTTHLALKASFDWKRQNRPPVGFDRDDTTTGVALVVNY
jgi:putative salt-induced outer membrane protein